MMTHDNQKDAHSNKIFDGYYNHLSGEGSWPLPAKQWIRTPTLHVKIEGTGSTFVNVKLIRTMESKSEFYAT
jgi:hypothetical protein